MIFSLEDPLVGELLFHVPPSPALMIGHGGVSGGAPAPPSRAFALTMYRSKSLILYGPSRLGKTVWSRSLGKHFYFGGIFSARDLNDDDVKYAVFDDIAGGIKFFPRFKDWLGCQMEFQVKQLYRDPQLFRWGRPCIWVANTDPRLEMTHDDIMWLEVNCIFVEITEAIFHANTE